MRKLLAVCLLSLIPMTANAKIPVGIHYGTVTGANPSAVPFFTATALGELAFIAIATDQAFPLCENPKPGSHAGSGLLAVGQCFYEYPNAPLAYNGSGNVQIIKASAEYPSGNQTHWNSL